MFYFKVHCIIIISNSFLDNTVLIYNSKKNEKLPDDHVIRADNLSYIRFFINNDPGKKVRIIHTVIAKYVRISLEYL